MRRLVIRAKNSILAYSAEAPQIVNANAATLTGVRSAHLARIKIYVSSRKKGVGSDAT
jgi:hypothetical protein